METIILHDTLSREMRPLVAGDGRRFRFYVCGPTVYGPAHIGNFLTFLRFDVLHRCLQVAGYNPIHVRNITDVDDKTIQGAREAGQSLATFTRFWTEAFHADCALLQLLRPEQEPRATDHIPEQIDLISKLVAKGFAYVGGDGSVYFKVNQFADYGKLSHFDPQSLLGQATNSAGKPNLADEYEREAVADFALWKARKEEDGNVFWESPYGPGRPGWHLECSAMSMRYLGESFDLHGGGEDLCFPHHENEIAQSEAVTGKPFAAHWMHAVHLLVEGKKMSKSLGNFFTLSDLTAKGYHPMEIRLALLGGHYRQQFNFTMDGLNAARAGLRKLARGIAEWHATAGLPLPAEIDRPADFGGPWGVFQPAWDALRQDLNTPAALGALHRCLRDAQPDNAADARNSLPALYTVLYALGLPLTAPSAETAGSAAPDSIRERAAARWQAKQSRDFATADAIRAELQAEGWLILDHKEGFSLQRRPAEEGDQG